MAYKSFWKTCRIALVMLALFFVVTPARALQVYLQDTDGNPLPADARWRVSGFEEGIWYESGSSYSLVDSGTYILYFYGKNVTWPESLTTNIINPETAVLTLQFPIYSNAISVIMNGPPTDSLVTWSFTAQPAALTNSTSYQSAYTNSFAVYDVATNTLPAIPHGLYKVMPGRVRGYNTPDGVIVDVTGDPLTNVVNLTYVPYSNTLAVTVYGYPVSNCEWSVVGPDEFTNAISYQATYTNNALISGVPTGRYAFNFPGVLGYSTPTNTLEITGDPITNDVEATYVLAYPTNIPSGEGIQKFYQNSYFFTNVYLHDSGVPLHSRFAAHNTNTAWGEITGTLSDQTDLQAAFDGKASIGAMAVVSGMVVIANGNIATNAGNIVTNAASILTLSGRVDNAEGAITTNAQAIGALSNEVDNINSNLAAIPTPTNQIIVVDGTAFVITNAPASAGDVLVFDPVSTTAYFSAQSGGGGLTEAEVKNVSPLMTNTQDVILGYYANASFQGTAIGYLSSATLSGVGVGRSAQGNNKGVGIGWQANGNTYGVALGRDANGYTYGVAVGYKSYAPNYATALGYLSRATNYSVSLGQGVTNTITNSTRVRGDLYLDGGTKIYTRETFNSGEFSELATGGATAGTYPVFAIPLGGAWTDFEIKASTNNFTDLVYYYKSWTNVQDATRGDTNALCYFTDDHAADVRVWNLKPQTNAISEMLVSTNSEVETVYFYPSHDCTIPWSEWMAATNAALVWSYVRVDDLGFEMNASGTKQHWSPIRPDSWEIERTMP